MSSGTRGGTRGLGRWWRIHLAPGGAANGAGVSGNPVLMAGSDGTNTRTLATDVTGRPAGSSFTFVTTNATTAVLKAGAGVLRSICVNPGVTSSLQIYNSNGAASGQIFGTSTAQSAPYCLQFGPHGVTCGTGITYTTTGGTPAQILFVWD